MSGFGSRPRKFFYILSRNEQIIPIGLRIPEDHEFSIVNILIDAYTIAVKGMQRFINKN